MQKLFLKTLSLGVAVCGLSATTFALTQRVSVDNFGNEGDSYSSNPAISPDGRYVFFQSAASNLVSDDTNNIQDVFVRDIINNTTIRVV